MGFSSSTHFAIGHLFIIQTIIWDVTFWSYCTAPLCILYEKTLARAGWLHGAVLLTITHMQHTHVPHHINHVCNWYCSGCTNKLSVAYWHFYGICVVIFMRSHLISCMVVFPLTFHRLGFRFHTAQVMSAHFHTQQSKNYWTHTAFHGSVLTNVALHLMWSVVKCCVHWIAVTFLKICL